MDSKTKYYAIIVAGGKGNRMNHVLAKQFLLLEGQPILMHTIHAFSSCNFQPEIILVLHESQHQFWAELCEQYNFTVPHHIVAGGKERFDSVKNALLWVKDNNEQATDHSEDETILVAVHDAVRPLVTPDLISSSYMLAQEKGNAVAAIQPVDSVRIKTVDTSTAAIDRTMLYLIQTPQTFNVRQLIQAYDQRYIAGFTDDASVVEKAGFTINILEGERSNIKITYPQDLAMASMLLSNKK